MAEELKQLIDLIAHLPETAIMGACIFVVYKLVMYMSTTGAIVFLGTKLLDKFPSWTIEITPKTDDKE